MSKRRPVLLSTDLIYATAFGLMANVGFAVRLDIELSNTVYVLRVSGG